MDDSRQTPQQRSEQLFNHASTPNVTKSDIDNVENLVERSGSGIVFIAMDG